MHNEYYFMEVYDMISRESITEGSMARTICRKRRNFPDPSSRGSTRKYKSILSALCAKILCLLILWNVVHPGNAQSTNGLLQMFRRESQRREIGIDAGFGMSVLGIVGVPVGLSLFTASAMLDYAQKISPEQRNTLTTASYAVTGASIFSLVVGLILWRDQEKKYMDVIKKQYSYRDFVRENREK